PASGAHEATPCRGDPKGSACEIFGCVDFTVQFTRVNEVPEKIEQLTGSGLSVRQHVFELRFVVGGAGKDGSQCFGLRCFQPNCRTNLFSVLKSNVSIAAKSFRRHYSTVRIGVSLNDDHEPHGRSPWFFILFWAAPE